MAWYRYFAYGSNMLTARLRERTPSAVLVGPAVLSNHALHFHHVSRKDGSAKCNILPGPAERESVHGVVFDIPAAEQPALDAAEDRDQGYQVVDRQVWLEGESIPVFCYLALPGTIDEQRQPFRWYRDLVLAGAREHGLPARYIERIADEPVVEDDDPQRAARHAALIRSDDESSKK